MKPATKKDKFVHYFVSKKTGKQMPVYFGDKRYTQVKKRNPKDKEKALKQARTLLRHYKGTENMRQPLVDPVHNIPTPKAMVATIWGFSHPITRRTQQREVVKYAENLLKKHS